MIEGVDVGGGDQHIDWPGLYAAGVRFAYVKMTEGETFRDPDAEANARGARDAKILIGCYHFFRLSSPLAQAQAFARRVKSIGGEQLEPVGDFEWCGRTDDWAGVPVWKRRFAIDLFLRATRDMLKVQPGAYTAAEFTDEKLDGDFPMGASPWLWTADASRESVAAGRPKKAKPWQTARIWQYGSRPAGAGRAGAGLDADRWMLSPEELTASIRSVS